MSSYEQNFGWPNIVGGASTPAIQTHVGWGYDRNGYISTAKLVPADYTTQALVAARLGGVNRLIESCDDSVPPVGSISPNNPPNNPVYLTYQAVIQTVVTEINGILSGVYPNPLAEIGTVAVLVVSEVDLVGGVTAVQVVQPGNYLSAPATANSPAYLRYVDDLSNAKYYGANWQQCQLGTGLVLTVAYADVNYADDSGQVLLAKAVSGTPTIATAGTGYQVDDLIVLTGGSSFVPGIVRQMTLDLVCHSLYQRRLAPEEKNPFSELAKMWRKQLKQVADGEVELDGMYRRFFAPVQAWSQQSVLFDAGSL